METKKQLSSVDHERLRENLEGIERRIQSACERSGRSRDDVTLVAVTKYGGPRLCQSLAQLGALDLGENRVPHLNQVAAGVDEELGARWHMIGHLQRNKVKKIEPRLALLHSLDSEELALAEGELGGDQGGQEDENRGGTEHGEFDLCERLQALDTLDAMIMSTTVQISEN